MHLLGRLISTLTQLLNAVSYSSKKAGNRKEERGGRGEKQRLETEMCAALKLASCVITLTLSKDHVTTFISVFMVKTEI